MTLIQASLSHRGFLSDPFVVGRGRPKLLVGRFLIALAAALRGAGGDSVVFGSGSARSHALGRDEHSMGVTAIASPYLWLRGRAPSLSRGRAESQSSVGGGWLLVLGAGVFALGAGRLWLLLSQGVTAEGGSGLLLEHARSASCDACPPRGHRGTDAGCRPRAAAGDVRRSAMVRGGRSLGLAVVEGRTRSGAGDAAGADTLATTAECSAVRSAQARAAGGLHGVAWVGVALALAAGLVIGLTPGTDAVALVALLIALVVLGARLLASGADAPCGRRLPLDRLGGAQLFGGLGPAWDDGLLLLSLALIVWTVLVLRRAELWTVPILLPALLAFAAAVGSVVVREVPDEVAIFALRVLFQPLILYFIGFLLPKNRRWVQWTTAVFLLSGVALALHGLFQYVTHAPMPASWVDVRETDIGTRAYSVIENPNGLGAFLLIGDAHFVESGSRSSSPAYPAPGHGGSCAWCNSVGSPSPSAAVPGWVWEPGVVALFILAYRRYLAPLAAAGVLVWFAAPAQFTNRLAFGFSSAYITKSLAAGRLYVWKLSLQHIGAHPLFGLGLGTFGGTAAVQVRLRTSVGGQLLSATGGGGGADPPRAVPMVAAPSGEGPGEGSCAEQRTRSCNRWPLGCSAPSSPWRWPTRRPACGRPSWWGWDSGS